MISYNNKDWLNLFQFKKADTIRKLLPLILVVCVYTGLIVYADDNWFEISESSPLKNFTVFHTLFGFVISMLLVFRTNTAYDRWWEGRKQWGDLINSSRNFAIKLNSILPADDDSRVFFRKIIPLFALALTRHLQAETTRWELDTEPHPELPSFDHTRHLPSQVVAAIAERLSKLLKDNKIRGEHILLVNPELGAFMNVCGACERIKNTPIPYSYSAFIKKFIFLYVATLPIGLAFTLHFVVVPVVGLAFYVLGSLELIAEEIEDPFGKNANDLPMEKMSESIRKNIDDILHTVKA